jgi:protein-S-isoprenylcysteine O-methyltransferase Ste14
VDGEESGMGIGVSIFLMAVGAILAFAVSADVSGVSLDAVGVILMIAGAIGLLWSLIVMSRNRAADHEVVERRHTT